jgi:hypothetical protein
MSTSILHSRLLSARLILNVVGLVGNELSSVMMRKKGVSPFSLYGNESNRQDKFIVDYSSDHFQHLAIMSPEVGGEARYCLQGILRWLQSLVSKKTVETSAFIKFHPTWELQATQSCLYVGEEKYKGLKFFRPSRYVTPRLEDLRIYKTPPDLSGANTDHLTPALFAARQLPPASFIVCLKTGDRFLWIMGYDGPVETVRQLMDLVNSADLAFKTDYLGASEITLPQISIQANDSEDLSFLKGLGIYQSRIDSVKTEIDVAFKPSEAPDFTDARRPDDKDLGFKKITIDGPFIFWVTPAGIGSADILLEGYIVPNDWDKTNRD